MAYVKHWKENDKINAVEKQKLEMDGLEIFDKISRYAERGFDAIPKEEWPMFKWAGLYLQRPREEGYFMMRVCVPSGILSGEQAVTLARIAKDYGRGIYDITTRQAVQFHWLRIEQIPDIFQRLEKVGLSTAGACGDITRNIVGNPLAGIDPDELLDTTWIVEDLFRFFQHHRDFSNLPRKYKMSVSANLGNASNAEINCVSFTPAVKEIGGEQVKGFHLKVGGGLSVRPFLAKTLNVFIRPEQVKEVAVAVTTIFRDYGYREKRTRNRLKFLVADWGPEKFREKLLEYTGPLPARGEEPVREWNAGYFYGVHPQKQAGRSYIGLNVPMGRLSADEVLELARLARKYGNGEIRNCNSQNIVLPHIPDAQVDSLLQEEIFRRIRVDPPKFIGYAVSCTGIEYCNLALVETKERMRRIAQYLDEHVDLDVPIRIHMVGCPNSCGQRQIADIGLQGIKMRSQDKRDFIEAFEIHVGGTLQGGGELNRKLKGKIAAEDLGRVLREFLLHFKEQKQSGETFHQFVHRVGVTQLQQVLDGILEWSQPRTAL
ncbi:nitrite/sulfite reductase [Kroppenstedtia eburnea]|uniref:Ferredoxin-nitrite reductase n=1 Tax=Kroppenstedtia eburnea TaxID=714067 RepID=A0A1N7MKQ0_9BACL|nr:ferredoxin--nitrite reductase [Kroppenstedtia eburnea]QKI81625.1 nitrite/sulfite reductase [Kroppenstedtia eburnea]SIS86509.1 ferredoxin-nitrite reductase [Kroppenstedtia eburnea]